MTKTGSNDSPTLLSTEAKDQTLAVGRPGTKGPGERLEGQVLTPQTQQESGLSDATVLVRPAGARESSDALPQSAIEVSKGSANKKKFPLEKGKLTIGRGSSNDLILNDDMISRNHARIYYHEGEYIFEDLGSGNGTFLDGQLITRVSLKSGNCIKLGSSELLFTATEGMPQSAKAAPEKTKPTMVPPSSSPKAEPVMAQDLTIAAPKGRSGREPASAQQPSLEVIKGKGSEKIVYLGKEKLRMGRASFNDLALNDQQISRSHAEIYFESGRYFIEDLQSTNGIAINGEPVFRAVLKSGDKIKMGETELLFTQRSPDISSKDKVAFMDKSDLLSLLDAETKELLAQSLVVRFYPKDTVIVRQNTLSESMYFLYAGSVRVVDLNEEGGERNIEKIKEGDYFGERALLAGESGNYSLVADSDLHLLELHKNQLSSLLQKKPELSQSFYKMVLTKLRSAQAAPERVNERQDGVGHMVTSTDVEIVGEDKKIKEARKKIEQLGKEEKPVLIIGAAGTGKRVYARYYHKMSAHKDYPYVEVSTADMEEGQVGAAIFGVQTSPEASHMNGQMGYLEMIGKGTLAIAHAETLDAHQQSKLATYIKYGWFHRVYGQESVKSKTTILLLCAGTEADVMSGLIPELKELFKENVIQIPSLSQRLKDIPILAEYHLKDFAKKDGKHIQLSREAVDKLVSYPWPGNVEELQNVIHRAAIVVPDDAMISEDLIFVIPPEKDVHKINILRNEKTRNFFRNPLIPNVFTWFNIFMVLVMAGFTLIGGSKPAEHPLQQFGTNPGMLITWLIWFPILPISAFLLGRVWCGVCPIAGIGTIAAKIKRFNLPAPKLLKKMDFWMVVVSFLFLDFTEEFLEVAKNPWATGMLLVGIVSLSALFCVLFERKTFCRYVCPLAGMLGAYSTMSIIEVRGNKKICQTQCGQHSCLKGTDKAPGCPMFSYPASLTTNAECMMCFNCAKSCDNRGVQINLRPPLQEMWRQTQPLLSLSLFGVMMVGLMGRHQFPNLDVSHAFQQAVGLGDQALHSLLYILFLSGAVVPFILSSMFSAAASQEKVKENMAFYGMAFIPLALSGHLGHVAHEFLGEGLYELLLYPLMLYNSLAKGVSIGSQTIEMTPFIVAPVITFIKFLIISGGALASLIALVMIARRISQRAVLSRILPHLMLLFFFWIIYFQIFVYGNPKQEADPAATASEPQASTAAPNPIAPAAGKDQTGATPSAAPPILASPHTAQQGAPDTTARAPSAPLTPLNITFSLMVPDIKGATSARFVDPIVSSWLKSATPVGGTGQYRLKIQGVATGVPKGTEARVILDLPASSQVQFISILDAGGNFAGYITISGNNQSIPLMIQLVNPARNTVLTTHKVVLN